MSIVTINLSNKKFNLACSPESHDRLLDLASKLDNEIKKITDVNSHVSFEMAIVMASLKLMDFKESGMKLSGGEAVENIEKDHQNQFNEISDALSKVINKTILK